MYLESLKAAIKSELYSASAQRAFEQAREQSVELRCYGTLIALLEILTSRDPDCQTKKEHLLRVLLALARQRSWPRLWKSVLLYVFLPGLCSTRHRYKTLADSSEDLAGVLWSVFFEVIETYPLERRSMATGIVMDTRKRFLQHIVAQEEKQRRWEELLHAFEQLPPEVRVSASVADTGPLLQLNDWDRHEMRAVLHQCPGLSEEDADLIWETDVCGVQLLEYLRAREGVARDTESLERTYTRLRRRKSRAKKPLYKYLEKILRPGCHISGSERPING